MPKAIVATITVSSLATNAAWLPARSCRVEPGMVRQHRAPGRRRQLLGKFLDLGPGRGVDDARPRLAAHQVRQLARQRLPRANRVADVGPVEPGDDQPLGRDAELLEHVGPGAVVGGRGQRQPRHLGKGIEQRTQLAVVGAEIVAPFGNAMRLVDGEQAQGRRRQQIAEGRLAGSLGRDVEQVELAGAKGVLRLAPVGIGAGQGRRGDAVGARRTQLVVHQRDQRGDHHAGARQDRRRQLVGQRLARARGHDRQRRLTRQDAPDDFVLHPAKLLEAEDGAQGIPRPVKTFDAVGHAKCCGRSAAWTEPVTGGILDVFYRRRVG